jgi:hypothetical protein
MNGSGKDWLTSLLATKITQIFTTRKSQPPVFLTWKAETDEEDREERSVEEGRNSPSQESGLNKKLAGNNNRCDSVTNTGDKESEREGDERKHIASKRTKKNTR